MNKFLVSWLEFKFDVTERIVRGRQFDILKGVKFLIELSICFSIALEVLSQKV